MGNQEYSMMTQKELDECVGGEALTLTAVMTILVVAIVTVVVYKLFKSSDGLVTLPGGYKFQRK